MTLPGKFFAITGGLLAAFCVGMAVFMFAQEFFARRSLPTEMQSAEMIQKHYDGEVILGSITLGIAFLMFGLLSAFIFGVLTGVSEAIGRSWRKNLDRSATAN
ncbi:MAG: hypothetical protein IPO41_07010 [Acidobacteria bacterium]|nr:hypothetical protein [Acidobacteriota bacterium]